MKKKAEGWKRAVEDNLVDLTDSAVRKFKKWGGGGAATPFKIFNTKHISENDFIFFRLIKWRLARLFCPVFLRFFL